MRRARGPASGDAIGRARDAGAPGPAAACQ